MKTNYSTMVASLLPWKTAGLSQGLPCRIIPTVTDGMKQNVLGALCLVSLALLPSSACAQYMQYTYDDAGNRDFKVFKSSSNAKSMRGGSGSVSGEELDDAFSGLAMSFYDDMVMVFILDYDNDMVCDVLLLSSEGKEMASVHAKSPVVKINTNNIAKGVYLVSATLNGKKKVWKFVKK